MHECMHACTLKSFLSEQTHRNRKYMDVLCYKVRLTCEEKDAVLAEINYYYYCYVVGVLD